MIHGQPSIKICCLFTSEGGRVPCWGVATPGTLTRVQLKDTSLLHTYFWSLTYAPGTCCPWSKLSAESCHVYVYCPTHISCPLCSVTQVSFLALLIISVNIRCKEFGFCPLIFVYCFFFAEANGVPGYKNTFKFIFTHYFSRPFFLSFVSYLSFVVSSSFFFLFFFLPYSLIIFSLLLFVLFVFLCFLLPQLSLQSRFDPSRRR